MATVNSSSSSSCPKTVKPARYCLCAPTTHRGSFRCRLHRPMAAAKKAATQTEPEVAAKEAAAAAVEEEAAAARALLARVMHKTRQDVGRGKGFQPRPSRLGIMDVGEFPGSV